MNETTARRDKMKNVRKIAPAGFEVLGGSHEAVAIALFIVRRISVTISK